MYKVSLLPELKEYIERPLGEKFLETQGIIARNLMEYKDRIAVAWSGGKDSTLVLYFVLSLYPNTPVIFNNTQIEYPETIRFVSQIKKLWSLNLTETKPERSFWSCVEARGFPGTKRGSKGGKICCYHLKEKPMIKALKANGLVAYFTGMTASENRTRMFVARDYGMCYTTKGIHKVHPILWWTTEEVKYYTEQQSIPMNPVYNLGAERCGCMFCTAFTSWEKQLSKTKPKVYEFVKKKMAGNK